METEATRTNQNPAPQTAEEDSAVHRTYRVVSFPGAGLDTVLQMGVIHALLVTRRRSPDMVAGISVGAITAAALGEVFHANAGPGASAEEDEEVRIARFSELLEAFRNAPSTVLKSFFPDPLETNAAHALKPVELPRHFKEERDSRQESVASRTGLIRLLNHLIRLRVSVKVFAQLCRVLMGWRAVSEAEWSRRWYTRGRLVARLWWIVASNIFSLSMPASLLARVGISTILGFNGRRHAKGVEAGHIMFDRWILLRRVWQFVVRLVLGVIPLLLLLLVVPALALLAMFTCFTSWPVHAAISEGAAFAIGLAVLASLAGWLSLLGRPTIFGDLLKHYQIFAELGDSYALKEALVQNFDPAYYGEFKFDDNVRRALKQESPSSGGCANKKPLKAYADASPEQGGMRVVPLAANLRTGKIEVIPKATSIVDALMCACAVVPFFRAQTIQKNGVPTTYIDGISVSNDPIVPVFEEACRVLTKPTERKRDRMRIISVPLLPLRHEKLSKPSEPYTGLVEVMLRAKQLQRFGDMLMDKGLIDRINRVLNGRPATIVDETCEAETFLPTKVRLVAPDSVPNLSLGLMRAGSVGERRKLIDTAAADGCRAMIERLVTDAMPDTRTLEERRFFLEPDEEIPDEWPHRDESRNYTLREAVESLRESKNTITRSNGREYVSCRKLMAAWGGLKPFPGGDSPDAANPEPGPGNAEVCRCCISCPGGAGRDGEPAEKELRQHIRLPRVGRTPFLPDAKPEEVKKGPSVVFLFSGGVFRGVFQVGFANAVSELGIQPDVIAGSSVGTIVGALTGRIFQRPSGLQLVERQRQTRRLAATFLTIDRFVLTDRFADFVRRFSIHAASADFSPQDLDLIFRRYEKDSDGNFSRRARRVFSGMERLFHLSPFELFHLSQTFRAGHWESAAEQVKKLIQQMMDRHGVGLELLGPEPLQQLIDGFVFDGKVAANTRLDYFGFPLIGTTTNFTVGKLEILRHTNPWDPRFTQSLLAGSAFPVVFRPRWSWEVYRRPEQVAQYADGGVLDNLPLGAVVEYLWGKDSASRVERRPAVPHLILTATLEPEKADWTEKEDVDRLGWAAINTRATQLRYNGKIDKFQRGQRDIRRIIKQRTAEGDPDVQSPDLPMNLDVLAVKPQWLCGTFAFHPMLGFSRKKQTESIAHGCASTICTVADHFHPGNTAHAINVELLRKWAIGRGIALDQLPERTNADAKGVFRYGPVELSAEEQEQGACWFRSVDPKTGRRPVCPFHPKSPACGGDSAVDEELHKIYLACGRRKNHEPRSV
jgi:predicted acylesterase/phospholipase RssA